MKTVFFSSAPYEIEVFTECNDSLPEPHELIFHEASLSKSTASLADNAECVCAFVNDELSAEVLNQLHALGIKLIALRSAGYNHVDLDAARELGLTIVRVPAYSPHAVAEHTVALLQTLNRQIHRAHNRVREGNFSLDGLVGFDLHQKTVGIIGTGQIGTVVAKILHGFGCKLLTHDPYPNVTCQELGANYVELDELFARSDIITLHCPLNDDSYHLINETALEQMKDGVVLINTSRGALIDTAAIISALKTRKVSLLGLDVYEAEGDYFFHDLSSSIIQDDRLSRLMTFPNVLITGHQAFLTNEALQGIAETTLANITAFKANTPLTNQV